MSTRTEELIHLARTRPLTPGERAELEPRAATEVDPLVLVEATAGGAQRLSPEEAERMFSATLRKPPLPVEHAANAEVMPLPIKARGRPARWPAVGLLVAAGVAALVFAPWPRSGERLKGGAAQVTIALAAQRPGTRVARALSTPVTLEPGEALRIVVTASAPVYGALFEVEGGALVPLWSSGASPLPAGQSVVGPDGAGLSLTRGHSELVMVTRERELPEGALDRLVADCPDCSVERFEVEQP